MNEYDAFIDCLRGGKSFLIASHYNPDGDGIGSTLAMGMLLEGMGKEVTLYNRDGVMPSLSFLPGSEKIVSRLPGGKAFDISVMVDCAQRKRISDEFASFAGLGKVACVDHHLLEKPEADSKLVDSEAASTGEVVMRIMKRARMAIDAKIAQCIYTTLVVDTGFFKYSNTNAGVLALAAELVGAGAEPWVVAKNLEESCSIARMRLLGASLASLVVAQGGSYATMDVTQEMLRASGATMELSDEFAVFPRSIEGVEISALFRELGDGKVKVSMRSKDVVDVAAISRGFGGGGHARAAGFQIKGTIDEVKKRVEAVVAAAFS
ncbi:MAG: DHH family phosphoesterase [Pseudomonadota bacterium]